jgi:gluconolactonase
MKLPNWIAASLLPAALLAGWVFAQPLVQPYGSIERLSPRLDRIIPRGAKVARPATGFKWVEGPVWIPAPGYLLFAEITNNRILEWRPNRGVSVFLHPSGYLGNKPYGGPEPGSNGMTLDPQGRLTVAGHAQRDIYRLENLDPHSRITILADSYQGKRLNSPNDLVYNTDGSLYFTDPPYGLPTQGDHDPLKQLPFNGVYRLPNAVRIPPGSAPRNSSLQLLINDLPRPNGIAFSPGQRYLYVDNSEPKKIWMRYPVHPDGTLGKGTLFYDATNDNSPGAPDGMKVDVNGDVFSAGPGGVWIFAPDGTHLGTIHVDGRVSNCAWGDADWKTLYITADPSIFSIRVNVAGIHP